MNANRPAGGRGASRSRFRPYVVPLRMDSTSVTTTETYEEFEGDVPHSHASQPSKSGENSGSSVQQSSTSAHASGESSGDSQTRPPADHEDSARPRSCGTSVAHDCSPCAEEEGKIKQEPVSPELNWSRPASASPGPSVKQEEF